MPPGDIDEVFDDGPSPWSSRNPISFSLPPRIMLTSPERPSPPLTKIFDRAWTPLPRATMLSLFLFPHPPLGTDDSFQFRHQNPRTRRLWGRFLLGAIFPTPSGSSSLRFCRRRNIFRVSGRLPTQNVKALFPPTGALFEWPVACFFSPGPRPRLPPRL